MKVYFWYHELDFGSLCIVHFWWIPSCIHMIMTILDSYCIKITSLEYGELGGDRLQETLIGEASLNWARYVIASFPGPSPWSLLRNFQHFMWLMRAKSQSKQQQQLHHDQKYLLNQRNVQLALQSRSQCQCVWPLMLDFLLIQTV